ncbi:MAG: hypothetical protein K2G52_08980 [Muribaculaceae bacterium]|nr:hypothetical protein [Muribaculaceae bacterium]
MDKPQFSHCNTIFTVSWILTVPLLINICTGCNLFSFWVSWLLFLLIAVISVIRLVHGFRQKCYKFCWCLIGELLLGGVVLGFFQLSFNDVLKTPVSDPVTPAVVDIAPPEVLDKDSLSKNSGIGNTHGKSLEHEKREKTRVDAK